MKPLRLVLVEDQALIRQGIEHLLRGLSNVELVAGAGTVAEGLAVIEAVRPDIALLDLGLPDGSGLGLAKSIKARWPEVRIVIVSSNDEPRAIAESLAAGAVSYLFKSSSLQELTEAIAAASEGRRYITPVLADKLAQWAESPAREALDRLSPRQKEILRLVAEGHSTKDIAARLSISITTVNTHRAEIMKRLDIHDVASITRFAIEQGLIGPA